MGLNERKISDELYRKLLIKALPSPPLPNPAQADAIDVGGNQHNPTAHWKKAFINTLDIEDLEYLHEYAQNNNYIDRELVDKYLKRNEKKEPFEIHFDTILDGKEILTKNALAFNPETMTRYTTHALTIQKIFEKDGEHYRLDGVLQLNVDKIKNY